MKNLMCALSIAGSALIAGNSYSQTDSLPKGDINIKKVSVDVFIQSEYGKSITGDFLMNNPHKLRTDKLTRNELELFYLDIATEYKKALENELELFYLDITTEYKKILEKYGNLQKDCEANKIKVVALESQVKALNSDKAKLQEELKKCNDSIPKEDIKRKLRWLLLKARLKH